MKCPQCGDGDTYILASEQPAVWVCKNDHIFDEKGVLEANKSSSFSTPVLDEELPDTPIQNPCSIFCPLSSRLCRQELEYCYASTREAIRQQLYQKHHIQDFPYETRFHTWKKSLCPGWMICSICALAGICPGCLPRMSKTMHVPEVWCDKHVSHSFLCLGE